MKTHSHLRLRTFSSVALAAVISLTAASLSPAKDKGGHGNNGHGGGDKHGAAGPKHEQKFEHKSEPKHEQKFVKKPEPKFEKKFEPKFEKKFEPKVVVQKGPHINEHTKVVYLAAPRSAYVLSPGTGYAGRGYYYGPPNSPYYYEGPDVKYFRRREDFPNGYTLQPYDQRAADELAVQQALARLGYYQGPIDGRIGPQTLAAIARYQQDHGMSITQSIVPALLQALGVQ
ncbi:peptidoglycan-binding protein [Prosthecobacter sp.]|uniref:peptidoglycan-binding protein n=1 Tax=Prosthecobacter sp. TaxID=1965333 RepID=UPI0037840E68